jgi:hypothetical protein
LRKLNVSVKAGANYYLDIKIGDHEPHGNINGRLNIPAQSSLNQQRQAPIRPKKVAIRR